MRAVLLWAVMCVSAWCALTARIPLALQLDADACCAANSCCCSEEEASCCSSKSTSPRGPVAVPSCGCGHGGVFTIKAKVDSQQCVTIAVPSSLAPGRHVEPSNARSPRSHAPPAPEPPVPRGRAG